MLQATGFRRGERLSRQREVLQKPLFGLILVALLVFSISGFFTISNSNQLPQPFSTTGRACAGSANVDDIQILPPGPVLLAADNVLELSATLFDINDNQLPGPPTWGATGGSLQVMDSHLARYAPTELGQQVVWACVGGVNQTVEIFVVIGEVVDLRLSVENENVTADDVVELAILRLDAPGNEQEAYVLDTTNWTYPEDSTLELPLGAAPRWTPGSVGEHTISVEDGGFTAAVSLNVSNGVATSLVIDGWASGEELSADDTVELQMALSDQRGNLVPVNGSWDLLGNAQIEPLEFIEGSNATFVASLAGAWTVEAKYSGDENGGFQFVGTTEIIVVPGRLAWLDLPGHGEVVRIGEPFELMPDGSDADGNPVDLTDLGWNVTGPSGMAAINTTAQTFSPTLVGQHVVLVDSGSRVSQITLEVVHGTPENLSIIGLDGEGLSVVTGESLEFNVTGEDAHGNIYPVDVEWIVPDGFGNITPGAGGVGDYEFKALGTGYVSMTITIENSSWTEVFHILPGEPAQIEIELIGEAIQGGTINVELSVYDEAGNPAVFGICSVDLTSTAGPTSCSAGVWTISVENGGDQQRVEAKLDDAYGRTYFDVQPVMFGGIFGSDQTVMLLGGILVAVLICGVLVAAYWKSGVMLQERKVVAEEEAARAAAEAVEEAIRTGAPPPLPVLAPNAPAPMASMSVPGLLKLGMPVPPPAHVFQTNDAIQPEVPLTAAPSMPPGLLGSTPSLPVPQFQTPPQTLVQTTAQYPAVHDFTAQAPLAHTTTPTRMLNVASVSGAGLSAALDAFSPTAESALAPTVDSGALNSALDAFAPAIEPDIMPAEDPLEAVSETAAEPVAEPMAEAVANRPTEPEINTELTDITEPTDDSSTDEKVKDGALAEAKADSVNSADLVVAEVSAVTGPSSDAGDPWIIEWYEPGMVLPRERGPRTDIQPMRAMPGTTPGNDGWYFDSVGRPSHWCHDDESGWFRTDE